MTFSHRRNWRGTINDAESEDVRIVSKVVIEGVPVYTTFVTTSLINVFSNREIFLRFFYVFEKPCIIIDYSSIL